MCFRALHENEAIIGAWFWVKHMYPLLNVFLLTTENNFSFLLLACLSNRLFCGRGGFRFSPHPFVDRENAMEEGTYNDEDGINLLDEVTEALKDFEYKDFEKE
jgi:hypothetical protein